MPIQLLPRREAPRTVGALVRVDTRVGGAVALKPAHAHRLEAAVGAGVQRAALAHGRRMHFGHMLCLLLDRGELVWAQVAAVLVVEQMDIAHVTAHAERRLEALAAEEALVLTSRLPVVLVHVLDETHVGGDALAAALAHVPHRVGVALDVLLEGAVVLELLLAERALDGGLGKPACGHRLGRPRLV